MEQKKRTKLNVFERIILGLTAIPVCIIASAAALVVGATGLVVGGLIVPCCICCEVDTSDFEPRRNNDRN